MRTLFQSIFFFFLPMTSIEFFSRPFILSAYSRESKSSTFVRDTFSLVMSEPVVAVTESDWNWPSPYCFTWLSARAIYSVLHENTFLNKRVNWNRQFSDQQTQWGNSWLLNRYVCVFVFYNDRNLNPKFLDSVLTSAEFLRSLSDKQLSTLEFKNVSSGCRLRTLVFHQL